MYNNMIGILSLQLIQQHVKGSDDSAQHSETLSLWILSIVLNSEWIDFRLQVKGRRQLLSWFP
jgi:hypothetical protein